jgi:putative FmdB family regulatory protein
MPLYEYECQSCHRRLEKIRKFSDPPLEVCPHCGGRLEKLISSPAFHLKGSGWYATDYARKGEKPASDSTTKDAKDAKDATATPDKSDKGSADKKDSSEAKPAADTKDTPKSGS